MMDSQAKQDGFESLMGELSGALADIVVAMQQKSEGTDEISSTLADLVAAIESKATGKSMEQIAQAIKAIRIESPAITVNVNPTPIQNIVQPAVVQIIERVQPGDYKLTVSYDNRDRITEAFISKIHNTSKE